MSTRGELYRKLLDDATAEGPLVMGEEQALHVASVVVKDIASCLKGEAGTERDLVAAAAFLHIIKRARPPLPVPFRKALEGLLATALKVEAVQIVPLGSLADRGVKEVVCSPVADRGRGLRGVDADAAPPRQSIGRCAKCGTQIFVSEDGRRLASAGAALVCIDCVQRSQE